MHAELEETNPRHAAPQLDLSAAIASGEIRRRSGAR
jgi:hypothetical protein